MVSTKKKQREEEEQRIKQAREDEENRVKDLWNRHGRNFVAIDGSFSSFILHY